MGNRTEPADGVGADTAGLDCVVRILILGIPQDRISIAGGANPSNKSSELECSPFWRSWLREGMVNKPYLSHECCPLHPAIENHGIGRSAPYWARLGLTVVFVAVAFLATLSLQHLFPYPFLFLFFGAVMAGAWFGGTAAGLLAVVLSTALVEYFFVPPFYSFAVNATAESYFVAFRRLCSGRQLGEFFAEEECRSTEQLRAINWSCEFWSAQRNFESRMLNFRSERRLFFIARQNLLACHA